MEEIFVTSLYHSRARNTIKERLPPQKIAGKQALLERRRTGGLFAHTEGRKHFVNGSFGGILTGQAGKGTLRIADAHPGSIQPKAILLAVQGFGQGIAGFLGGAQLALGSRLAVPSSWATA